MFPCGRSPLSRGRAAFFKSPLWMRRADAAAGTAGSAARPETAGALGVARLTAARIHFLILERFLDLSGVRGDSGAHGPSCSQSERSLSFPSL